MLTRRETLAGSTAALLPGTARKGVALPLVRLQTPYGAILVELATDRAPITAANFLRYVDLGLFDRGSFYRVVRPDNDHNPAAISVVQGGLYPDDTPLPPIAHESTAQTGLRNRAGMLSMARDAPGTATSEFSISVTDNPALDFGGRRQPDGQGFAAFGRVVRGMDVVRRINRLPAHGASSDAYIAGQMLAPRIPFGPVRRVPN
jgi:peptidyl-prolyl cis-trans isomerase A (cyclophilin A)